MTSDLVFFIVFFVIIFILCILNLLQALKEYTALKPVQVSFLFSSSFFLLLFFGLFGKILFRRHYVIIMPLIALYPLWYYLTKFTVNKINGTNNVENNI